MNGFLCLMMVMVLAVIMILIMTMTMILIVLMTIIRWGVQSGTTTEFVCWVQQLSLEGLGFGVRV